MLPLEEGLDQEEVRDSGCYPMWYNQAVSMRTTTLVQNIGQLCPVSLPSKSPSPCMPVKAGP